MKEYGIMLIGCGYIGTEHLADIYYRPGINIIATIDKSKSKAEATAKKYGALFYGTDYRKYLDDDRVDIVIVATYPDTHYSITKECVEHGKHVLCEKPISRNLPDGLDFCKLVKKTTCKIQVSHVLRHNKSYQKIKELIDSGIIGNLRAIRMVQNQHAINWDRYKALMENCMPVVDCGVHYVDVVRWFTGSEINSVSGFAAKIDDDAPKPNYNVLDFKTESGCYGYYECCWSKSIGAENVKEFIGTKGRITLTLQSHRGDCLSDGDLICIYSNDSNEYRSICYNSRYKDMYAQLLSLIDSIENDKPTVPSYEDVWKAQQIVLLAEKAILSGKTVNIETSGLECIVSER